MNWESIRLDFIGKWPEYSSKFHPNARNLIGFVEGIGVRVVQKDLGNLASTLTFAEVPVISFHSKASPERVRFSVAHELGHLIMHKLEYHGDISFGINHPVEVQADRFAASLLMPANLIECAVLGGAKTQDLSKIFGVSTDAVSWWLPRLAF